MATPLRKLDSPVRDEQLKESDTKYLTVLIEKRKSADASLNSFVEFLHVEYKLTPGQDQITAEGKIIRKQSTEDK